MRSLAKVNGSIWTKIRIGATAARGAVTLFGTALLSAIPIVGQILMVVSLLGPLFSGLFGKGKMEQELEKITDSFKSFVTIAEQLKETLEGDITATESFVATLRVQVGVMNQIISAHQKYIDKLKDDRLDTIMEKTKELKEMQEGGWHFSWVGGFVWGAVQSKSAITDLGIEISGLKDNLNRLDIDSMKAIAKEAKAMLTSTPKLAAVMKDNIEAYDKLIKEVSGKGKVTTQEFMARLKEIAREKNTTLAAIDGARQTMGDLTKETIALGSKVNTPFDNLIDKSKTLAVEFAAAGKDGGMGFDAFKAGAVGLQAQLDHIRAKNNIPLVMNDSFVLNSMNSSLTAVRDKLLTSKARVKELGNEQKKLNKIAKDHPKALEGSLQLSEDIRVEKLSLLDAELEGLDIIVKTAEQSERIIQIDAEKTALAAEKVSIEDRGLQVIVAEVTEKNKILALGEKLNSEAKEALQHELKMADIAQRAEEARSGKKTTAGEAFKRFKEEKETKQTIIAMELAGKLTSIEMEYALLDAQLALQKQRAIEAKLDVSAYERISNLMSAGKSGALVAAINTAVLAGEALDADEVGAERAALTASRTAGGTTSDRIGEATGPGGALDPDSTLATIGDKTAAAVNAMQPMMELMGPEGGLISAVANGAVAITDAWSDAFKNMGKEGVSSMAVAMDAASATLGALGSILAESSKGRIAGVDDEIAAEQKRDGQSAASVAKIKKLEAKKEAIKRKAFETDKKIRMAQTIMNTASGIMAYMEEKNIPMAVATGVMGAIQLATIASTSYKGGGGSAPQASIPSSVTVGSRNASVDLASANNAGGEQAYMRGESGIGSNMSNFKPSFTGGRTGGNTQFKVGEQGPEMFIPDRPGRIAPAGETQNAGGMTNVNFSISAVDATGVEELLMNQRGNIIGMLREAANEHGQMFLEGVQEKTY